jgi:hypothetical protein
MSNQVLQSIKRYKGELVSMAAEAREESDRQSLDVAAAMSLLTITILIVNEVAPRDPKARALVDELVDRIPEILEQGPVNLDVAIYDSKDLLESAKSSLNGARLTNTLGAINVLYNTRTQKDISFISGITDGPFGPVGAYAAYLGRTMLGAKETPNMIALMDLVAKHTTNIGSSFGNSTQTATSSNGSSSCFIATACFGDPNNETVLLYRSFRERVLKKTKFGRQLVLLYYKISPSVADYIKEKAWLKKMIADSLSVFAKLLR